MNNQSLVGRSCVCDFVLLSLSLVTSRGCVTSAVSWFSTSDLLLLPLLLVGLLQIKNFRMSIIILQHTDI